MNRKGRKEGIILDCSKIDRRLKGWPVATFLCPGTFSGTFPHDYRVYLIGNRGVGQALKESNHMAVCSLQNYLLLTSQPAACWYSFDILWMNCKWEAKLTRLTLNPWSIPSTIRDSKPTSPAALSTYCMLQFSLFTLTYPPNYPSTHPSTHPSINLSSLSNVSVDWDYLLNLSLSLCLSLSLFLCVSIHQSVRLFVGLSV